MTRARTRRSRGAIGIGLVAALTFMLGACGSDDDTASTEATVAVEGGGDSESADAGASEESGDSGQANPGAADDDFSIPRPDGLVLDALADSGIDSPGQRQLYYEDDDFDRVVAFYDDWTAGDGGWTRGESGGIVVFSGVDTERVRTISITPDHDPGAQADGPVTYVLLLDNG